eukprot:2002917-Prymnesium_polylepis.1
MEEETNAASSADETLPAGGLLQRRGSMGHATSRTGATAENCVSDDGLLRQMCVDLSPCCNLGIAIGVVADAGSSLMNHDYITRKYV